MPATREKVAGTSYDRTFSIVILICLVISGINLINFVQKKFVYPEYVCYIEDAHQVDEKTLYENYQIIRNPNDHTLVIRYVPKGE